MNCINCGKLLVHKQHKYCSSKCQTEYQNNQKIALWKKGEFDGLKGESQLSDVIRKYMLEKAGYQCQQCNWGETNPFTDTIPLEIHHIDGNYLNCKEENLIVLCPNCHSLTKNYRGANKTGRPDRMLRVPRKNFCVDCGVEISRNATRCVKCAGLNFRTEIPVSRDELKNLIRTKPFTQIGQMFNVTDNAVRKWCDKYNLPRKVADIRKITDAQWQEI